MATAVTITIDGKPGAPGETQIRQESQASEAGERTRRKLIDRGPEVEVSHSSAREAIQEIHGMVGARVWITSTLREEGIDVGFQEGVLEPISFLEDGDISLTLKSQTAQIYTPTTTAADRHVESGLVVLRTAGGFEMEFQVIAGG